MIKINYDTCVKLKYDFDVILLSKKIANTIFKLERIDYDFSLNLVFVTKNVIKSINKKERNINKVTDVLSFPNIEFLKPSGFSKFITKKEIDVSIIDLNTNTIFLGDIVICKDIMEKQAIAYAHSIKREFSFLFTHSLLHLLGYDHMNKKDEKIMFDKQDKILEMLKISK